LLEAHWFHVRLLTKLYTSLSAQSVARGQTTTGEDPADHHQQHHLTWCLECCNGSVDVEGATTQRWSSVADRERERSSLIKCVKLFTLTDNKQLYFIISTKLMVKVMSGRCELCTLSSAQPLVIIINQLRLRWGQNTARAPYSQTNKNTRCKNSVHYSSCKCVL